MEEKIRKYFELKSQLAAIKGELDETRNQLKELFGELKVDITMGDEVVRIQTKTRVNKRCDWNTFKTMNNELYNELVTETTCKYIELRKVAS